MKLSTGYRMPCSVLRCASGYDSTNGGLSSRVEMCLLVGDDYEQGTAPADRPAFRLRTREVFGKTYLHAIPADIPESEEGFTSWMNGGNFLWTSDSRFPADYPIPIHDRRETWAQYDRLSV